MNVKSLGKYLELDSDKVFFFFLSSAMVSSLALLQCEF